MNKHLATALSLTTLSLAAASTGCADNSDDPPPEERVYVPETGTQSVMAGDIEIAYFEQGEGPLVLLLHGFPDTAHTWDEVAPQIAAAGYHTVTPFMRGYAPSTIPGGDDYGPVILGEDVIALIDALGYSSAIVIGHDWGASAAYAAANIAPERIDKLVTLAIAHPLAFAGHPDALAASPHFVTLAQPGAAEDFAANDFAAMDELYALWSPDWQPTEADLDPVKNAFLAPGGTEAALGYYRAFATQPLAAVLFQPTSVPTLTFAGSSDGAGDPAPFADHEAAFTGPIELVTLPVGHFIHREAEADVVQQVLAFLAQP